jgi:CheY-like chemotaxis protein
MSSAASLRILIADDNRATAFTFGKVLEKLGHRVEVVLNGLAAMDVVRQFKPQVALVDIGMPGIDGHEVTRQIRNEPGFEHIRIFIVSGRNGSDDIAMSKEAGADDYLVKPIDYDKLRALLAEAAESVEPQTSG